MNRCYFYSFHSHLSCCVLLTFNSWVNFCIDCCIPPNWPYIRSLTFSKESRTFEKRRKLLRKMNTFTKCAFLKRIQCPVPRYSSFTVSYSYQQNVSWAYLSDVPHLVPQLIDRPLSCHHFLLLVGARALHQTIHSGPMLLSGLFPANAIGHRVLGEQDSKAHISASGCV